MKKFLLTLVLILTLTFSTTSFAEVQSFKFPGFEFSCAVNVPKNWTATQNGATVTIKSNKRNSSLSIAIANKGEATLEDVANRLCKQLNGKELERDDDGDYTFSYKDMAGAEFLVLLTEMNETTYGLLAFSFENERDEETINKMLSSAEFKTDNEEDEDN